MYIYLVYSDLESGGAAVVEWLSSWLAEQEDRGSIPSLATWIFRDWFISCFQVTIWLKILLKRHKS